MVLLLLLLLNVLEALGRLLLVDDTLALTVLNVTEDLFMSLSLFLVLGALFTQLQIEELILLAEDRRIFLEALTGKLQ